MYKVIFAFLVSGIWLTLGVSHTAYASKDWKPAQPTPEEFDKIIRLKWQNPNGTLNSEAFGAPPSRLCIETPYHPAPDSRSKTMAPLAWHFDFLKDSIQSKHREKQIRQLDALVNIGFLKKLNKVINYNGSEKEAIRYSLTENGWAASTFNEHAACIPYGELRYLGVSQIEPKAINNRSGLEMYDVKVKIGLSNKEIAPWARDSMIQEEFPQIKKSLDEREFPLIFVRGAGEWIEYQSFLMNESTNNTVKENISKQNIPTIDEVKSLLQKSHGTSTWNNSCVNLPSSTRGKSPVDKDLSTHNPPHYSVAVFTNKPRTKYDEVQKKTIPYLNMLETLGILEMHTENGMPDGETGTLYDAKVYELTHAFKNRTHPNSPSCLPLGGPTVEFIDIKVSDNNRTNPPYKYKLKILYKNPPHWMKDPSLMRGWPDLRGAIENGKACSESSCWWAFDSYYENY